MTPTLHWPPLRLSLSLPDTSWYQAPMMQPSDNQDSVFVVLALRCEAWFCLVKGLTFFKHRAGSTAWLTKPSP